jgi:hypothetical protein
MQRPQSLQKFIQNSGVQIQRSSPPTFPRRLQNSMINNENMGEFAQFVYNENNSPVSRLSLSGLNPGMFNATVNKDFDAESRVDLKYILNKTPLDRTALGGGLYIDTKEMVGYYGRFKTGFSHTREYGKKGNINEKFFTVQVKFSITNGTETSGGTVNFYKNGKIRFSGGFVGKGEEIVNQPELIRKFMVKKYTPGQSFLYNRFEYNNLSGQFRMNGVFKNMARLHANSMRYGFKSNYEPEISPMMYALYKGHKYIIAKSGAIQISGASNPSALNAAYNAASGFFSMLYAKGEIQLTSNVPKNMARKTVTVRAKVSTCPKSRRPPCKPGYQAKKNPQGDECCYKIPKRKSTRKSPTNNSKKITYDNDGTMRVGKKKCAALTKSTLLDVAKKMGVVGAKASNKKDKICGMIKNLDLGNSTFKVKGKSCVSYKKDELIALALNNGVSVEDSDTVKTLCEKLKLSENKAKKNAANRAKLAKNLNRALKNNAKNAVTEKKRRLNTNSVRNDIIKLYGPRWMKKYKNVMNIEKDVKDMTNLLNNASKESNLTNKKGILKKMPANDIKRDQVSEWKQARVLQYKKKLIQKEYGKHGNAVVNYILTHSPTKTKIKEFIKKYEKTRANLAKRT